MSFWSRSHRPVPLFKFTGAFSSASHTSDMSFLIFLVAVLLSPLALSATLSQSGHGIAARHNTMPANLRCSDYYGRPEPVDCEAVVASVEAFRKGAFGDTTAFNEYYDEFVQSGADDQYPDTELSWQLPIYWREGEYTLQRSSEHSSF